MRPILPLLILLPIPACDPDVETLCDDGLDNEVDGLVDCEDPDCDDKAVCEDCDEGVWYADADGDGSGDATASVTSCTQPDGHVSDAADCDDADGSVFPGAPEACDAVDNDCDDVVDNVVAGDVVPMACLPHGSFFMGSPSNEEGREDDEASHAVTLTHDFEAGQAEVTQAAFEAVRGYNPSTTNVGDDFPVETVTWFEAAAFANALSDLDGLENCYTCTGEGEVVECAPKGDPYACDGYRLPTEAEWEYAARGGSDAAFPTGGNIVPGTGDLCPEEPLALDNGTFVNDFAWYCGNTETTMFTAQLDPNAWGLYDTAGNVYEWVNDVYDAAYYDASPINDPPGPSTAGQRVFRGGCYYTSSTGIRSANRSSYGDYRASPMLGFRVVRVPQ